MFTLSTYIYKLGLSKRSGKALSSCIILFEAISNFKIIIKAEFKHPVSTCVFCIALQFFITYLGFAQSR